MVNDLKSHALTISIITLVREQLTAMQEAFIDALAQQQAALEAQHQRLIKTLRKELRNVNILIIETPTVTPTNKIKITIYKPSPSNANPKLVIVALPIPITNPVPTIKLEKLPNPLIFNGN